MTRSRSSPPDGAPPSPIWEGLLGTAEVVAWALVLELGREVVVSSFGENPTVEVIAGTLRGLAVVLVLVAGGYVLFRRTAGFREERRADRELAMVADLVEPGSVVGDSGVGGCTEAPERVSLQVDGPNVAALRDLPVHEFETAALLAVLMAILEAPVRLPTDSLSEERTAPMFLAELRTSGIVEYLGSDRYCLRKVPIDPDIGTVVADPQWQAALPALVGHHADRAARWAIALESTHFAKGARRWFEAEEPYLRRLLLACAEPVLAPHISVAAALELARISDAIDIWYARKRSHTHQFAVAMSLAEITALAEFPVHRDLIRLRANRRYPRPPVYRPRGLSTSLSARWEHHEALHGLATASANEAQLTAAERQLESAWWLLPRADVAGQVCALINLAVVHLKQNRLDAAKDRLELAESLTESGRDPGGRAHTHETLGALWWTRGEPRRALRYWQRALSSYLALDDDLGTARCLQHLGSAMVVAPGHGSLLLPPDPPLTRTEVLRQASGWLAEACRLNRTDLAEEYALLAHTALGGTGPLPRAQSAQPSNITGALPTIDRWPLLAVR